MALNGTQSNDGKRYSVRDMFSSTGTANLLTNIASVENAMFDEALLDSYELPVGAIVKTFPSPIKAYASIWPTLVLPVSALPTLAASS